MGGENASEEEPDVINIIVLVRSRHDNLVNVDVDVNAAAAAAGVLLLELLLLLLFHIFSGMVKPNLFEGFCDGM